VKLRFSNQRAGFVNKEHKKERRERCAIAKAAAWAIEKIFDMKGVV